MCYCLELLQDLVNVEALLHQVIETAEHYLFTFAKHHNLFDISDKFKLVSHKNDTLFSKHAQNSLLVDCIGARVLHLK